jgi:hypothetical protein
MYLIKLLGVFFGYFSFSIFPAFKKKKKKKGRSVFPLDFPVQCKTDDAADKEEEEEERRKCFSMRFSSSMRNR